MAATRLNPTERVETVDGWKVIRKLDGRVECRKDFASSNPTWAAWGSLYEAKVTDSVNYPFTFSLRPSIRVEPYYLGNAISGIEVGPCGITSPYKVMPYIYVLRPSVPTANNDYRVTVYVTGYPA